MYIIAILIGIIGAFTFATIDANVLKKRYIYKKEKPKRVLVRATFLTIAYSYWLITYPIILVGFLMAISICVFALLFDGILNTKRGLPWFYRGTESTIDELSRGHEITQTAIYVALLVLFSIIYFILL